MKSEEWNPGRLLAISGSYWQGCTLHAAVKLGLFTAIDNKRLSSDEVAKELNSDSRATTLLLNALAAMHLLAKEGNKYSNTPASTDFLCKDSPKYVGYMILHHHYLMDSWSRLDEAVKTGRPVRTRASQGDEARRESFLMGMFNMAMNLAPRIVEQLDLSGRKHLLDLGGGPGTYAVHFCLNNPGLRATVYDLPTTEPFAEKTIEKFGLSDRIAFMPGDYVDGP
ncbi:MAG: methyltransferase dimerization domain-containing protein, partial [Pseudomonadota bacterium]